MVNELEIYCKNTNDAISVDGGDTLLDIAHTLSGRLSLRQPLCALVNNRVQSLRYQVFRPKHVEFVDITNPHGRRCYTQSLVMLLYKALHDLYPGKRLIVEHSIGGGHYCVIKHEEDFATPEVVTALREHMRELVEQDLPIVPHERMTADVAHMFERQGLKDKVRLLQHSKKFYTTYYKLGDIIDSFTVPPVPSTGVLDVFDLQPYRKGMLLMGPDPSNPDRSLEPVDQPKLYRAFTDYINLNKVIKVGDVGELNNIIKSGQAAMLINVVEALHNKMFAKIADDITERYHRGGARVVLIAGPSSSGKTTSSKRLAIQLMANYITPKVIELDNYFVDRERTPRDESGDFDFESLYALDLEQLGKDLTALLAGDEVAMPTYNFGAGTREYRGNTMRLEPGDILLMEGIHGLNPELVPSIPDEQKYRVFVSALTTLNIDDHNWVSTYDNRLLRRIIRDHKYRNYGAHDTLKRWPSVRRGEEKWIMPFHENADAMFNSALLFELAVMKSYAEPLLRQVPVNSPEYAEASRLLNFLSCFEHLDERDIPSTSLLREFLGGSSFHY